jgi:hybrid cluster-associated redox disulfide protein
LIRVELPGLKSAKELTYEMLLGKDIDMRVFMKYGLHCVGCHVAAFETIEQGAKGHGMSDEVIQSVIRDARSSDEQDRDRAWRMLDNMDLRFYEPGRR